MTLCQGWVQFRQFAMCEVQFSVICKKLLIVRLVFIDKHEKDFHRMAGFSISLNKEVIKCNYHAVSLLCVQQNTNMINCHKNNPLHISGTSGMHCTCST